MDKVYFIKSENFVKIGFTSEKMANRIGNLQTCSPHELELLGAIPGPKRLEDLLHRKFEKFNARGEWFLLSEEVLMISTVLL
jgi:hypothetical protein